MPRSRGVCGRGTARRISALSQPRCSLGKATEAARDQRHAASRGMKYFVRLEKAVHLPSLQHSHHSSLHLCFLLRFYRLLAYIYSFRPSRFRSSPPQGLPSLFNMSDLPRLVPETSHQSSPRSQHDFSPSCPFCVIARTYSPISPLAAAEDSLELDPDKLEPPSFVLYSSAHVIAFLDIMPLTRGHVLVAPRKHRVKVGDLSPDEGAEVCRSLKPSFVRDEWVD